MQLGFVWLMLQLVETDSDRMFVIGTWVLGAVAAAVGSVYSYLTGTDFVAHTDRYSVAGADPNELALGLALAVPLTWYLGFKLRNSGARIFFRLCTLPLVVGIIFTGSRGGAIALLASLMVIPLCRKQIGIITKGTIILCCIAALTAGAALVPEGSLKRLSSIGDEISRNDMAGRGVLWSAGWAQFKQHPFVGVGAGAYPISISVAANATMVAHNTFISVLTELGCMGFAVYLLILARLLYLVLRMPNPERFVWFVVFLSWGIGVCALTWENSKPTWLIFALILAQSRQSQAEREGYYDESLLGQAGTAMEVVS
jgi:O-antigen ligase